MILQWTENIYGLILFDSLFNSAINILIFPEHYHQFQTKTMWNFEQLT